LHSLKYSIPPDYPQRIKRLRAQAGLTQTALARLLGVTPATVNRWEKGQARPSTRYWREILRAETLGVGSWDQDDNGQDVLEEPGVIYDTAQEVAPDLDFSADAEIVRLVTEGQRLAYGYLFNPTFAAETSLIDPLPHQRMAVYEHMLPQTRLRFLLADDAGAGKTIMAGLYMREMLARRLIRRILIVPPAGLVSNWERELRTLFNLAFRVVSGSEAKSGNPFHGPESDLLIVSIDTLTGERMFTCLQEPALVPYDLVVFDEAHKLSADQEQDFHIRKTDRYRLGDAPAGACILYAISCGLSDRDLADRYDLLARSGGRAQEEDEESDSQEEPGEGSGSAYRLKAWGQRKRPDMGYDPALDSAPARLPLFPDLEAQAIPSREIPLIDQAHRLMHLWKAGEVVQVDEYLDLRGLRHSTLFQQLLQALIELAPAGSEERSLLESISNHIAGRGVSAPRLL
jgi:transcriptional regulator with XRE-family HTH domain